MNPGEYEKRRREISGSELAEAIGLDNDEIHERKEYVGFDGDDIQTLEEMMSVFEDLEDEIAEDFYDHTMSFEGTREVIDRSDVTADYLKKVHGPYLTRMGMGDYGREYFEDRTRIGKLHEMVDMPVKYYVGTYMLYYDRVISEIFDGLKSEKTDDADIDEANDRVISFLRATNLDLQVAMDTYIDSYTKEVERKNDRLEEFAEVVSHDLRNPLNVAQGHLEIAASQTTDETVENSLREVDEALGRMEELIQDVLELARHGRSIENVSAVSLSDAVEEAWDNVDTRDAEIEVEVDDGNDSVCSDHDRLIQLLENLFRNSMDHGGDVSEVRVGRLEDGFYVEDDGVGIPEGERDDIFESGFTTSDEGTGLGLSIVKEIAEAHGWRIEVTEGDDGGARFEIRGVESA
ncbi:protoglobin domain-containing protein [Halorutilales archaeon Cl-col2-1]